MKRLYLHHALVLLAFTLSGCGGGQVDPETLEITSGRRLEVIGNISDAETEKVLRDMAELLQFMLEVDREMKVAPTETRHTMSKLAVLNDYSDISRMAEVFAGSVVADQKGAYHVDAILPFSYPFPYAIEWHSMTFDDGQSVEIKQEADYDDQNPDIQVLDDSSWLTIVNNPPDADPEGPSLTPVAINGSFSTELPDEVLTLALGRDDIGRSLPLGKYLVRLADIEEHFVAVDISASDGEVVDDDAVIVEAQDAAGRNLYESASGWGQFDWPQIVTTLDTLIGKAVAGEFTVSDQASLEAIADEIIGMDAPSKVLHGEFAFRGAVDTVQITILSLESTRIEKPVSAPAVKFGYTVWNEVPAPLPVSGPVYDHDIAGALRETPFDLTQEEIATQVSAQYRHAYGGHRISFSYPAVLSDWFVSSYYRFDGYAEELVSVELLDTQGKPITIDDDDAVEINRASIIFDPALLPALPARARGRFVAQRMAEPVHYSLTLDELPQEIRVEGNMLVLDTRASDTTYRFFAKDASGRYLRELGNLNYRDSVPDRHPPVTAYYFYGDIAELDVFEAGDIESVPFNFDVSLIPEEDAGEPD